MIGIDTNVLVRYVTRDDPDQYAKAKNVLESECTPERPGFVSSVVLCELVWVLKSAYHATRDEIAGVIETMLLTRQLDVGDPDTVWVALDVYRQHDTDFADCLIGEINLRAGCSDTATFDRSAGVLPGFRLL